jgi:starch synthase
VLFVGRITRQKGILHLVRAIRHLRPGVQVVLCAGAPDTKEIGEEMAALVDPVKRDAPVPVVVDPRDAPQGAGHRPLLARRRLRLPLGLRAVRDHQPGGDGVRDAGGRLGGGRHPGNRGAGETGVLVPIEAEGGGSVEPRDPEAFSRALADAVNELMDAPGRRAAMGRAARARVEAHFSWRAIAGQTLDFYRELLARPGRADP